MTPVEFAQRFPKLYHVTEPGAHESMLEHGMRSTASLLELFEVPETEKQTLLETRRPHAVPIHHPVYGDAVLNDQKPLSMKALATCLDDGLTPIDWLHRLNRSVFFWPDNVQLQRLLGARMNRGRSREVLVLDTEKLLESHFERLYLCPINSGNTMRRPARRGLTTFAKAMDYEWEAWRRLRGRLDRVVEIAILDQVEITRDSLIEIYLT